MGAGVALDEVVPQCPTGPTGNTGPNGSTGPTGATGNVGTSGVGNTGPNGQTGANGPQGAPGAVGPTGDSGNQGKTGPTGAAGSPGPFGNTYVNTATGTGGQVLIVNCNSGDFATGGGVTTQGGTPVQASEAVFNGSPATTDETPNGWRGEQETLNPNAPFSVYVICAGGQPQ
jgi:hypothetical protein